MVAQREPDEDNDLRRRVEEAVRQFRSSAEEVRRVAGDLGRRRRSAETHLISIAERLDAAAGVLESELHAGPDPSAAVMGARLGRRAFLVGLVAVATGAAEHVGAEIIDALRGEDAKVDAVTARVEQAAASGSPSIGDRFLVAVVEADDTQVLVDYVSDDEQSLVALPQAVFARSGIGDLVALAPGEIIEMVALGGTVDGGSEWLPIGRHPADDP